MNNVFFAPISPALPCSLPLSRRLFLLPPLSTSSIPIWLLPAGREGERETKLLPVRKALPGAQQTAAHE